jgi:hypothetical protein
MRSLLILLRRERVTINRKETRRLYKQESLAVRQRRSRKRGACARAPAPVLALPNPRWSLALDAGALLRAATKPCTIRSPLADGSRFSPWPIT